MDIVCIVFEMADSIIFNQKLPFMNQLFYFVQPYGCLYLCIIYIVLKLSIRMPKKLFLKVNNLSTDVAFLFLFSRFHWNLSTIIFYCIKSSSRFVRQLFILNHVQFLILSALTPAFLKKKKSLPGFFFFLFSLSFLQLMKSKLSGAFILLYSYQ